MPRKININITPTKFKDLQGKTIQVQIKKAKPTFLTPPELARLV